MQRKKGDVRARARALGTDERCLDGHWSLTADGEAELLRFAGPLLFVGDGSFGIAKDEALFPGLEWLVKGEKSSSDLDIDAAHADRFRWVPPSQQDHEIP